MTGANGAASEAMLPRLADLDSPHPFFRLDARLVHRTVGVHDRYRLDRRTLADDLAPFGFRIVGRC